VQDRLFTALVAFAALEAFGNIKRHVIFSLWINLLIALQLYRTFCQGPDA
jgi:hypothetical protein